MLAVLVLAGCSKTVVDEFTVVTPVAHVRALAGKDTVQMHGTSCKSICTTRRDYKQINYCVIATLDVNPHLACRVRRSGGSAPGYAFTAARAPPENRSADMRPKRCNAGAILRYEEHAFTAEERCRSTANPGATESASDYEQPLVEPQFGHLWQAPLRTISVPHS